MRRVGIISIVFLFFLILAGNAQAYLLYQEHPNATFGCSGDWESGCGNITDGDWDTYSNITGGGGEEAKTGYFWFNYTKPENAVGAILELKDGGGIVNVTVPQNCFDAMPENLMFGILSVWDTANYYAEWDCSLDPEGSSLQVMRTYNGASEIYEEPLYWNITEFSCQTLSTENAMYTLNANIENSTSSTCFSFVANNITLDCNGFTINMTNVSSTVFDFNNVINANVKNCVIYAKNGDDNTLVLTDGVSNLTYQNNSAYVVGKSWSGSANDNVVNIVGNYFNQSCYHEIVHEPSLRMTGQYVNYDNNVFDGYCNNITSSGTNTFERLNHSTITNSIFNIAGSADEPLTFHGIHGNVIDNITINATNLQYANAGMVGRFCCGTDNIFKNSRLYLNWTFNLYAVNSIGNNMTWDNIYMEATGNQLTVHINDYDNVTIKNSVFSGNTITISGKSTTPANNTLYNLRFQNVTVNKKIRVEDAGTVNHHYIFDYLNSNTSTADSAMDVSNVSNLLVMNSNFKNTGIGKAVSLVNVTNATFDGISIQNTTGISLNRIYTISVSNLNIINSRSSAFSASNMNNVSLMGVNIMNSTGLGLNFANITNLLLDDIFVQNITTALVLTNVTGNVNVLNANFSGFSGSSTGCSIVASSMNMTNSACSGISGYGMSVGNSSAGSGTINVYFSTFTGNVSAVSVRNNMVVNIYNSTVTRINIYPLSNVSFPLPIMGSLRTMNFSAINCYNCTMNDAENTSAIDASQVNVYWNLNVINPILANVNIYDLQDNLISSFSGNNNLWVRQFFQNASGRTNTTPNSIQLSKSGYVPKTDSIEMNTNKDYTASMILIVPVIDPSSITGQLVLTLGFGIMGLFAVLTLLGFGYLETTGKPDPETIAKIMIGIVIIILMIVAVWSGIMTPP